MKTDVTKNLTLEEYLDTFGEPIASAASVMLQLIRRNSEYLARTQETLGELNDI